MLLEPSDFIDLIDIRVICGGNTHHVQLIGCSNRRIAMQTSRVLKQGPAFCKREDAVNSLNQRPLCDLVSPVGRIPGSRNQGVEVGKAPYTFLSRSANASHCCSMRLCKSRVLIPRGNVCTSEHSKCLIIL